MKHGMKAVLSLALALGLLGLSGCGTPAGGASASSGSSQREALRVAPMGEPLDVSLLTEGDNSFSAGFQGSDIYLNDDGALVIDLTVYGCELYDAVDISLLAPGDTLVVKGQDVPVESVEQGEYVAVNGGLEQGGIDLVSAGGGTYQVALENDARDLYEAGRVTLPVDQNFLLTDDSDPENPGRTFYPGDLLEMGDEVFPPLGTTVETVNGRIVAIHRDYIP